MPVDKIRRGNAPAVTGFPNANTIRIDPDDETLYHGTGGSGSSERTIISSPFTISLAGSGSAYGMQFNINVLTGNEGLRQGGLDINLERASDQPFIATWDGNPDCGVSIVANNRANNLDGVTLIGAVRALNLQARNRGSNIAWVQGIELNARNDSGKICNTLYGMHIRIENYGTVNDALYGLDIELSSENDTSSPTKDAILVRNTDLSGMSVVGSVVKLSNTSTNGFGALLDLTGLAPANGTLISTSGTEATVFAGRIRILNAGGTAAWINVYSTSNEA